MGRTNRPGGAGQGRWGRVLQVLQQAISADSRLKTTPREQIAESLMHDGRLPKDTAPELVYEVLRIMREGGMGLRQSDLQPCSIEFFWDAEAGRVHDGIDLSMGVDWTGAPPVWEGRELPENLLTTTADHARI